MDVLTNFLTSGHHFSENDNLQKFRFAFLNVLMVIASFFTFLNFLGSFLGVIDFGNVFEKATLFFVVLNILVIYLLRRNKSYYPYVVFFFIATSLLLFYFVLLTRKEDEFRLIAFFLALFIAYVLLGKKRGLALAIFIMASILVIRNNYDLELSSFAYSTFFTFFIIFTGFLYFFLKKVESDSFEFELLNNTLKAKVRQETEQRLEQEQMLLRQCRMANMGEMLDSIAHQWRQPLMHINAILMNMENSLDADKTKKQGRDYLENKIDEVATLTTHMSQTIEDFRGLFKKEKELTHFILQNVIDDVLVLMKNNLNDIELEYNTEDDVFVLGHRSELMQVVIILLSNAIEVLNNRNVEKKRIVIHIGSSDKLAIISLEDNAGGINPSNAEQIFDPYFTTKEQSGGTGLGLYIAKIIVEHKMDGNISVTNTTEGAKFTLFLTRETSQPVSN